MIQERLQLSKLETPSTYDFVRPTPVADASITGISTVTSTTASHRTSNRLILLRRASAALRSDLDQCSVAPTPRIQP